MRGFKQSAVARWLLIMMILSLGLNYKLFAQTSTASVNGIVRDSSGAVVPSAEVTLRNIETNVERQARTNNVGAYGILDLPPGHYVATASQTGFKVSKTEMFSLVVNQTATIDFSLETGAVTEQVTVSDISTQVQASTSELGTVIANEQVQNLPLNGRNFTQLLTLVAGASPISVSQNAGGFGSAVTPGSAFTFPSVNGSTNRSNLFFLDGVNNTEGFVSTYAIPPIIDAIQEFKVQSHNDSAEFGGSTGGIVNVVTKSGTNQYHGSLWEYIRNDAFDSRNWYNPDQTVPTFRQNQFGATVGGPLSIPKLYNGINKTFFFFGYEGYRFSAPEGSGQSRVPTAAELGGDLSDITNQIYDPYSTTVDGAGVAHRLPFLCDGGGNPIGSSGAGTPCNKIPTGLIDPKAVLWAQTVLPQPNATIPGPLGLNYLNPVLQRISHNDYTGRVDHHLSNRDNIFFRYSILNGTTNRAPGWPGLLAGVGDSATNYAINWVHTFSSDTILQAQFGHNHVGQNNFSRFADVDTDALNQGIGYQAGFADYATPGITPRMNFNTQGWLGGGPSINNYIDLSNVYQWKGDLTHIHNSHTFKFGGEFSTDPMQLLLVRPDLNFDARTTADQTLGGGDPFASFLLGLPDSAGHSEKPENTRFGGVMGLYGQDSWKATSKLTINFGLRYDRTFIPAYGTLSQIGQVGGPETGTLDYNTGNYIIQILPPSCAERGHAPCINTPDGSLPEHVIVSSNTPKLFHDDTRNFQPRFGFAYKLTNKTALRGGFGMFFDNWSAITQLSNNNSGQWPDTGSTGVSNLNVPTTANPTPNVHFEDPLNGQSAALPAPTPWGNAAWYPDPNHKNAYSMQWNLGIQQELNYSTVLTVNYVGSESRRMDVGAMGNVGLYPSATVPLEQRVPYPYMPAANAWFDRAAGGGDYNALQVTVDKKYSSGLGYLVSYTWSKSMDNGCSGGWFSIEGCQLQDVYHPETSRSVSAYDLTHILNISWVYQIPVGKNKRYQTGSNFLDHVIGDWQLNGITNIHSGVPYTVLDSADTANVGISNERPDTVGNPNSGTCSNGSRVGGLNCWFNGAAYQVATFGTFGNTGRNSLRSDGTLNFDMSVFRQFPFGERRAVEFRAEAFNIFNHPTWAAPGTDIQSPGSFGVVTGSANTARQLQFGLKVLF